MVSLVGVDTDGADLVLDPLPAIVSNHNPVRIKVANNSQKVANYSWSLKKGPEEPEYASPLNLPYLVIQEGSLQKGFSYIFTLTANVDGANVSADAKFTVNEAPADGTVTVSPSTGIELMTEFKMTATGWKDKDELHYPLKYAWRFLNADDEERDLCTPDLSNWYQSTLVGISHQEHSLTIICLVYDSLETYTDFKTQVTLQPNNNKASIVDSYIATLPDIDVDDIPSVLNTYGAIAEHSPE